MVSLIRSQTDSLTVFIFVYFNINDWIFKAYLSSQRLEYNCFCHASSVDGNVSLLDHCFGPTEISQQQYLQNEKPFHNTFSTLTHLSKKEKMVNITAVKH